jgi:NitT/TauT family transport system ATP-binding protein
VATKPFLCAMRDVCHDFSQPSGQTLRVLDGITLEVRDHEVLALLGPSGCGKSTILRILAGLIHPTSGVIEQDGKALTGLNPQVAMVFQSFALFPWMTSRGNIQAALAPRNLSPEAQLARADEVIKLVGLTPFANSYPRELSGGMKQRIGIARGLAVDRELLFMDEPFSQVDALTAESLRSEVIDLWNSTDGNPRSVVMVSHDIKEVVYMADRIVVLSANPGRIRSVVENPLPRPRDYRSPDFLRLVDHIHDIITGHELPDHVESATPKPATTAKGKVPIELEPVPDARPGQIVGLIEYLAARRGQEDIFRIAAATGQEFGRIIHVVRAAELLDLVDTPKRIVALTPEGNHFATVDAAGRQRIFRDKCLELGIFRHIHDTLLKQESKSLEREYVDEIIVLQMPQEDHQRQFELLMTWGRFAGLFEYTEATDTIALVQDAPSDSAPLPAAP